MTTRYHSSTPGLGDLIAGRTSGRHLERTGVNVRRGSVDVDDQRALRFSLPFHEEEQAALIQAVERWDLENKEEGKYFGPLRGRGLAVFRWLLREAKAGKGVFAPSGRQIAEACKIGLRTVRRIMKALYIGGFLEWQRRSIEKDKGDGMRRHQTSSTYKLNLPKPLAGLVTRLVSARLGGTWAEVRSARIIGPAELADRADAWERGLRGDTRLAGALALIARALDGGA